MYSFVVTFLDAVAGLRIGGPRRYPRRALFLEHPMNVAAIVRKIPGPTIVSTFNFAALVCTTVELYSGQEILSAGPLVYASPLRALCPARLVPAAMVGMTPRRPVRGGEGRGTGGVFCAE